MEDLGVVRGELNHVDLSLGPLQEFAELPFLVGDDLGGSLPQGSLQLLQGERAGTVLLRDVVKPIEGLRIERRHQGAPLNGLTVMTTLPLCSVTTCTVPNVCVVRATPLTLCVCVLPC
jgi:hypothetical protein